MKGSWETIQTAFAEALRLVAGLDPRLLEILEMTLQVSLGALFLATLLGLPIGALCGLEAGPRFRGLIKLFSGLACRQSASPCRGPARLLRGGAECDRYHARMLD